MLKGPVSGVQSDTMAGFFGSTQSGLVTNGIGPKWRMGDHAEGNSASRKEQLLERDIPINGIASKWSMGDRVVGNGAGSKEYLKERVIPNGEELGINPAYAVHDPMGCSISHNDQSGIGILLGT